jgi:two-component system LytT family response regulator
MPGETGMELLESLEPPVPHVIFTTAYDEFAVKAFDLNALDYLLNPWTRAAGRCAIEKAARPRSAAAADVGGKARPARARGQGLRPRGRPLLVRRGEVDPAPGERGQLHPRAFRRCAAAAFPFAQRDGGAARPAAFFRANRRQIINLAWIEGIEPWFSGGLLVQLKGGAKVELSRRQAQEFRDKMSL